MDLSVFFVVCSLKFLCLFVVVNVLLTGAGLFAIRYYLTHSKRRCESDADMTGRVVIVTGSNTGIGKETARALAARNARVILACRSVERGQEALQDIIKTTGNSNIAVKECNLASLRSVRNFAYDFINSETRLDVLICNAGTGTPFGRYLTEDGFEMQFQSNHLGHFLLVQLLLEMLRSSAPARIVITSSLAHRFGNIDFANIARADKYESHPFLTYCDTKLANVLFMKELSRLLIDSGITANALHPGTIYTNGIRHNKIWYVKWLLLVLSYLYNKNEEEGAQTIIYLAVSDEVAQVTGKYYADCQPTNYSPLADDPTLARSLWDLSEELVKVTKAK